MTEQINAPELVNAYLQLKEARSEALSSIALIDAEMEKVAETLASVGVHVDLPKTPAPAKAKTAKHVEAEAEVEDEPVEAEEEEYEEVPVEAPTGARFSKKSRENMAPPLAVPVQGAVYDAPVVVDPGVARIRAESGAIGPTVSEEVATNQRIANEISALLNGYR